MKTKKALKVMATIFGIMVAGLYIRANAYADDALCDEISDGINFFCGYNMGGMFVDSDLCSSYSMRYSAFNCDGQEDDGPCNNDPGLSSKAEGCDM